MASKHEGISGQEPVTQELPKKKERPAFSAELVRQGRVYEALYEAEQGILPIDHPVTQQIQTLLDEHPIQDKPARIRVSLQSTEPEAFVLPNGAIVVSRGLLKMLDTQELRVVIGHEATHFARRDSQEFSKMVEEMRDDRRLVKQVRLLGSMRAAEQRADIQGIVEGDKAGTHPAALRTLMQKLERWGIEQGITDPSLIHGSEIDRTVNAGIAAQIYDFESDYLTRTPLSQEIQDFCQQLSAARFPDSGECELEEATVAFAAATPQEVLSCLRNWRSADRAHAAQVKQDQIDSLEQTLSDDAYDTSAERKAIEKELAELQAGELEIPILGEGYKAAVDRLGQHIKARLPATSPLQRSALLHFLVDSAASITENELVDSPIEGLVDYLGQLDDREQLEEIRRVLSPEVLEGLGVYLTDGQGLARFSGAIFRGANESELYQVGKQFDVEGYLESCGAFLEATARILSERSLTGGSGFALSEPMLGELLVNIDTKQTTTPAALAVLRFQDFLMANGMPPLASKLFKVFKDQHFFKRTVSEALPEELERQFGQREDTPTVEQFLTAELYKKVDPYFQDKDVTIYGVFLGLETFAYFSEASLFVGTERPSGLTTQEMKKMLQLPSKISVDGVDLRGPMAVILQEAHPAFVSEHNERVDTFVALSTSLGFDKAFGTKEGVGKFFQGINNLYEDTKDQPGVQVEFAALCACAVTFLLWDETLTWLPADRHARLHEITRLMIDVPGGVTSYVVLNAGFLEGLAFSAPKGARFEHALTLARAILNDDATADRAADAHTRYRQQSPPDAFRKASIDPVDDLVEFLNLAASGDKDRLEQLSKKQAVEFMHQFDEFVFQHCQTVPIHINREDPLMNAGQDMVMHILKGQQIELEDPLSRQLLLSLASRIHDPIVRSRVVKAVIEHELAGASQRTPADTIELLWKNKHVRFVALGDIRERFLDEQVTTEKELKGLSDLALETVERVGSPDKFGVYALLERIEKKKDAFELFTWAYEYSFDDTKAKQEFFNFIRQDWRLSGYVATDEEAILHTESLLSNLEMADSLVKHAIARKLLIGANGLLHTPDKRKRLFEYLLSKGVDSSGSSPELVAITGEVLPMIAEVVETDVLFAALAPFLQAKLFAPSQNKADWEQILLDIYDRNRVTVKRTLNRLDDLKGYQTNWAEEAKEGVVSVGQQLNARLESIGIKLTPETEQLEPKPTLEAMVVQIAESLGAPLTRFLQVLEQYVETLSPDLQRAFREIFDNVRGQLKLTAFNTIQRRAPNLKIPRMGKRAGGGSLMSTYDCDVEDGAAGDVRREAVKVLAPNAEFLSDLVLTSIGHVVERLAEQNPERYAPAIEAFKDIAAWIQADINDTRFFELDPAFRQTHSGFRVPGMRYGLYVPESRPIDGDPHASANKYVKREEFVQGVTLNRILAEPGTHDVRQAVSLVAKVFAQQLMTGIMHSDIHPGNYIVCERDGQDWIAMIDRSLYLELDQDDQQLILGLSQGSAPENQAELLQTYFFRDPVGGALPLETWLGFVQTLQIQGEAGLRSIMANLRALGVKIPLKLTLLLKNIGSLNRMCRRAGFDSFREAIGYLPEAA